MILLGKVKGSLSFTHASQAYGCVASIALEREDARVRIKDKIQLRNSDGSVIDTYVAAVDRGTYDHFLAKESNSIVIFLASGITKQIVTPGTEIWSLRD